MKFKVGDIAYLIESNRFIREGKIKQYFNGLYLFQFVEGGAIRVKEHRLYVSEEEAQAEIDKVKKQGSQFERNNSPYDYW